MNGSKWRILSLTLIALALIIAIVVLAIAKETSSVAAFMGALLAILATLGVIHITHPGDGV